jgi:phytanoyl-CoA hydroxylase
LAFGGLLEPQEVERGRDAVSELVERAARGGAEFQVQREPALPAVQAEVGVEELAVRKLMGFRRAHPFLQELAESDARLSALVGDLLGEPPVLFQDMALIKPPGVGSEKPWHQEAAYFDVLPLSAVVGVWIALDDATVANGCVHVMPGSQQRGPLRHWLGPVSVPDGQGGFRASTHRDCQVLTDRRGDAASVPVELRAGGVLLFASLLLHCSPPNGSGSRRRALQFHYRGQSARSVPRADYDRVFCEADGSPASCGAAAARQDEG